MRNLGDLVSAKKAANRGGVCKVLLCQKSMFGRWRGAWARAGWRVWDLGDAWIIEETSFYNPWVTVRSCCKSCSIPNGNLLPNFSSSRLFLSAFLFHQPRKFPVWRKFAAENRVNFQRGDWTGVKWSSQSRKTNLLTLQDLAFGFVHKRSGNEINFPPKSGEKPYLEKLSRFSLWRDFLNNNIQATISALW